ncbi:Inositol-pentakisphosphate 2-kinase [Platanthera guangdongensis]|uniref:Inositol-pentakisphosphate 2-kinase n=1 Tax=Platanthera guangdongensis TaxID=2320717 RepID=A0ABR2MFS2_9ASPA
MELILRAEDSKDWVYKGEGAANIVLSYTGSSDYLLGKVLRIHKVPRGRTKSTNVSSFLSRHEILLWRDIGENVESISKEVVGQLFILNVMSPLLDPKHVDGGIRVIVSKEFLERVGKNILGQRPGQRVDVSEVDVFCDSALLINDHSLISRKSGTLKEEVCFAVEIKPKCGYLPNSEFIAKKNSFKKNVPRFEMHQILKLHQGEISQLSRYNPLDLFSGKKERINQAISALLSTPQNNFRVFLNGSCIFGGLGGGVDNAAVSCHDRNGEIEDLMKVCGLPLDSFPELITEAIFSSVALGRLLASQKLDHYDIEGAIHAYYNIVYEPCLACKTCSDPDSLLRYSFLHDLSLEESLKIVRDYLIAATAKDCSLMISFRHAEDMGDDEFNSVFLKSSNQYFDYKVNFIDLDMKPLQKMDYYYELDQEIATVYAKYMQNEVSSCNSANFSEEGNEVQWEQ